MFRLVIVIVQMIMGGKDPGEKKMLDQNQMFGKYHAGDR
jgi:hypothetical protein